MKDRAAALIVRDGLLLVIHRLKYGKEYYCLPGGGIEKGESPEDACVRELAEETSLRMKSFEKIGTINNQGRTEHYFLCTAFSGEPGLGGPEQEYQSENNQHILEWADAATLKTIDIKPPCTRDMCLKALYDDDHSSC